jgi:sugar phosphate isomerase/epimerase
MGVTTVCTMSGLPAGAKGDSMPNWVTNAWPPETKKMLSYQWDVALSYWHDMATFAKSCGVTHIALELRANHLVFNVPGLSRLREAIGLSIGANLDPSHLFWMGADPLSVATALGSAIYHVHAKDTVLNTPVQATRSLLETGSLTDIPHRAWSYVTPDFGHGEAWWRAFCYHLLMAGYNGWLSIKHEDVLLNAHEGLQKSVDLLQRVMPSQLADFKLQDI